MSSVTSFLAKNKAYFRAPVSRSKGQKDASKVLTVVVLSASENHIVIGHLGREFTLRQDDVLSITDAPENTPNLFGQGRPAQILLKKTAVLVQAVRMPVRTLETGKPFTVARPSTIPPTRGEFYSPRELTWRRLHQLPTTSVLDSVIGSIGSTAGGTLTWTNTQSLGGPGNPTILDDSNADDSNLDDSDNLSTRGVRGTSSYSWDMTASTTSSQGVQDDNGCDDSAPGDVID